MKRSSKIAALSAAVLVCLGLSSTAVAGGRPDLVANGLKAGVPHQQGELLVKFKDGSTAADQGAVRRGLGAQKIDTVRGGGNGRGELALYKLPPGLSVGDAVYALSADPAVEYAEPNWIYTHAATSNDTYVTSGQLWGMASASATGGAPANQFGSGASTAWANNKQNCGNVVVGVIDEGIFFTHEDLAANIWVNPFDGSNGADDDGNGYADDIRGWNFVDNNNQIFKAGGDNHGTHVAGTIAGVGGNGKGVAGVCWSGVKVISGKFLGTNGGTTANAIKAVDYMTDLKTRHGLNLVATNNSWGGGGYSQGLADAITRAGNANILFIAAAGNSGADNDATPSYPASYANNNIVAVASITSTGAMSSFSQYGATSVDICAPGSGIWSSVSVRSKGQYVSGYASYNGTSMATPHVTGGAALYAARNPGASAPTIKSALLNSATATSSCNGKVVSNGRLNVSGF
jgi:subtilisin family serine protease